MLTGKLVRVRVARNKLIPQYVDVSNDNLRDIAENLLLIFRGMTGKTRVEMEEELKEVIGDNPTQLVHQGLAKLLEDRCDFEIDAQHPPPDVREKIFLAASAARKNHTFHRPSIISETALHFLTSSDQIEQTFFADLRDEQRITGFSDLTVDQLLNRYNVSLVQAVLLRATSVRVDIYGETPSRYRQLFRSIKFHRLMFDVRPLPGEGHQIILDGPMSLFQSTSKYGMQLAMALPAILQCKRYEITAKVLWGAKRQEKVLNVSVTDGLRSTTIDYGDYNPPELAQFAQSFSDKISDWSLSLAPEIVTLPSGTWIPDFVLTHNESGLCIPLEIVGFWRKTNAEKLYQRLSSEHPGPFLLAFSEQNRVDEDESQPNGNVYYFKRTPLPSEVVKLANQLLGVTGE